VKSSTSNKTVILRTCDFIDLRVKSSTSNKTVILSEAPDRLIA
jgi:hypothetical protein